jgi:hypothetical protein
MIRRPRRCSHRAALFVPLAMSLSLVAPRAAEAQASNYPSLQVPTASVRDYTGAVASGGGTSLVFQWREGIGTGMHLGLDAGFTDLKRSENLLGFIGGSIGSELLRARGDQPLDLMLTGGVGVAFGGGTTVFRVPLGISVGHTFDLDEGMSLTPYVHPRVSLDLCSDCSPTGRNRSELSVNFDVGTSFQINRQFAVRAALVFSGSNFLGDDDAFAIGATWTPAPLRR